MNLAAKARTLQVYVAVSACQGYAMAALLVAISVMAVMLSVAMPTWSHMVRREKEEELIFRGNQYARAINLYQRKYANASPANLDVLIKERMLRKKFKDPLSPEKDGEFQLLHFQPNPSSRGTPQGNPAAGTAGRGGGVVGTTGRGIGGSIGPSPSGTGPVVGVVSKNTGQSIRVYKDKTHYNEWQFIGLELSTQAGPGGAPGRAGAQRGGAPPRGAQQGSPQRGNQVGGQRGGPGVDRPFMTPDSGTPFTPAGRGPR